jgi:hypothetical protein
MSVLTPGAKTASTPYQLTATYKQPILRASEPQTATEQMPIVATPEVGIPFPFDTTPEELTDFREKAHALFQTVQELVAQGAEVEITEEDKKKSHEIFSSQKLPPVKNITSGTIVNLEAILNEWDHEVLDVHRRLRNYVTNKMIAESVDPDPRQRMKALENLGKLAGVGIFSDRIDINVTHRTVKDIETDLARTLEMYMGAVETIEATEITPKSLKDIDLDDEDDYEELDDESLDAEDIADDGPQPTS